MILTSCTCMSNEDFERYKQRLSKKVKAHTSPEHDTRDQGFPCLMLTLVDLSNSDKAFFSHLSIEKVDLLKILGLSTEELTLSFNMKETIPETTLAELESREI